MNSSEHINKKVLLEVSKSFSNKNSFKCIRIILWIEEFYINQRKINFDQAMIACILLEHCRQAQSNHQRISTHSFLYFVNSPQIIFLDPQVQFFIKKLNKFWNFYFTLEKNKSCSLSKNEEFKNKKNYQKEHILKDKLIKIQEKLNKVWMHAKSGCMPDWFFFIH